ncbi:MAG TPA: DUF4296 domain-containing protein [Bacteroidales bacterium]|nr:DUF4296 domain-containing protein [Bacteroidales bacterium]
MIRIAYLTLILVILLTNGCSNRKNKLDHNQMIPEKELISILTEVYITDGLLTIPKIHYMFSSLDSLSSYFQIIEKHGYSKETMDKTMKYYFIKKPKKLITIYDHVLGTLSEMESYLERESALEDASNRNLWKGLEYFSFPDPSITDSVLLNLKLNRTGVYTLTFTATLFPDDQSLNPRISLYSCHPDSIYSGKRNYIETIYYIKDGQPHNYTLTINVYPKQTLYLRGCFYDFDNHPDEWEKHAIIETILILNTSLTI